MNKFLFSYFAFLLGVSSLIAQEQGLFCPTDSLYYVRLKNDSVFRKEQEEIEQKWEEAQRQVLEKKRRRKRDLISDYRAEYPVDTDKNYIIPVVFHIIYDKEITPTLREGNNRRITELLRYVNEVYAGTANNIKNFTNGGVYAPIQFAFAKRTVDNQPSTGIYHIDGRSIPNYQQNGLGSKGASEKNIEALSNFPRNFALNIYIVNKLQNGASAYAYVGGHGTVWCGYGAARKGVTTLPHELGHTLSLFHVFNGSQNGQCPNDTGDCKKDNDKICDTESIKPWTTRFNSPGGINPCTNKAFEGGDYNIMDYSYLARDRFTPGQVYRMIFQIEHNGIKQSLLNSLALTPPSPPREAIDVVDAQCSPSKINKAGNAAYIGVRNIDFGDLVYRSGGYSAEKKVYIDNTLNEKINNAKYIVGQTYDYTLSTGGNSHAHKFFVFIDYNNNGIFETSEKIYANPSLTDRATFKVTIPNDATLNTPIRMRVVADYKNSGLNPPDCPVHNYGQTEDFAITIIPNPAEAKNKMGINTDNPQTALDIVSENQGVIFPKMSNQQMWRIENPKLGMLVYNLNEHCLALNYGKEFPRWRCLATLPISALNEGSVMENNTVARPVAPVTEGKVGINTENPQGVLEVNSEYFGVQFPRLSNEDIKKIEKPEEGLMLYNTSENCLSINVRTSATPAWRCIKTINR